MSAAGASMIDVEGATFALPGMAPAQDVTLSVVPGELVAVTGVEGAGKSTLLRGLLGLAALQSGRARVLGVDLHQLAHDDAMRMRARCAYASKTAPLLANLTLFDNLAVPLLMRSIPEASARAEVERMLKRFGLEALALRRPPDVLGDKLRLAQLARALLVPAELVLLDEPPDTDAANTAIEEACASGQTMLVSTTRPERFARARRVTLTRGTD